MRYTRTQVYLDPDDHRALNDEAHRRGISLAALMREIVSRYRAGRGAAVEEKSFDGLIGVIKGGPATDIVNEEARYKRDAAGRAYERKLPGPRSRHGA
jgi:hypothetical protein